MSDDRIPLTVPQGSLVHNFLYPDLQAEDLSEDLVHVVLPNGIVIDAGWFPHADPNGHFVIRATEGAQELACIELVDEVLGTSLSDPYVVAEVVSELADQHSSEEPWSIVSCSDFTTFCPSDTFTV